MKAMFSRGSRNFVLSSQLPSTLIGVAIGSGIVLLVHPLFEHGLLFDFLVMTATLLMGVTAYIAGRNQSRLECIAKEQEAKEQHFERLEYILEGAGLGAWDWWLDSNRVVFDRRWCEMLGLNVEEIPHELSTWDTRVHPEDKDRAYVDIKAYLDGKTPYYENVHRMKHASGHWVWILDRGRVSEWDSSGRPTRFTGTHLDISHYKQKDSFTEELQRISKIGGWELDVATGKTTWTEQIYKIYEISPNTPTDKIMGINYYAPHERPRIASCVQRCIEGIPYRETFEFVDAQGNQKWVESRGEPVRDVEGRVFKLRGTFQDITDIKRTEILVQKQKNQLEHYMQNSPSMVYQFRLEPNGGMSMPFVSKHAAEIYETPVESFRNRPSILIEMTESPEREKLVELIQQSAKTLKPFEWTGSIVTPSGKKKWLMARSIPMLEPTGSVIWDGIIIEITRDVEMREELDKERSRAVHNAKLASLGEMSAGIAHEINNPLAVISGNLALLKKLRSDEFKFSAKIDAIEKASARISKIVTGLRKFSRTTEGSEHKLESLSNIIEEALLLTEAKCKRHSTPITVSAPTNLWLHCDSVEIEQVLVNLINNAVDAVKNLPQRWIKLRAFSMDDQIVVQVEDSGPGISLEAEEKIFRPFYTTKPVGAGTGLGLSISKGILDQHKADFSVNREFANTCFEIRFPASNTRKDSLPEAA
jgi:PAS domain S-box-containing protein